MSYADYSPLIRGLTWDGTSGLLVQYSENQIENAQIIELSSGLSLSDALSVLRPVFANLNGKFPAALNVAGAGAYLLGSRLNKLGKLQDSDTQIRRAAGMVAVVTGGAQGFGETLVRGLFSEGAVVAIADMNFDGAQSLAASLNTEAGEERAFACRVNVADEVSVCRLLVDR